MMSAPPRLEIHADPQALFLAAAERFVKIGNEAIPARGVFFVALAGGNTPREFYHLLAQEKWQARVPWTHTHIFFGDERCVPPDHPDSNYRMAREVLLDKISIPKNNVHRMPGEDQPGAAAEEYQNEILKTFAEHGMARPCFDLILLGIGSDGHTASLFPGTAAIREKQNLVAANHVEKFKSHRLTMTLPLLNLARHVIFLVVGASKTAIIKDILHVRHHTGPYPAELVRPAHGRVLWMLDRAAAAGLQSAAG